ncbi:hypothetical protein [Caulobacter sp. BP25]|uniref:hypothetical protein n=1 Tax=Caulobacter sp. BP25 TaxID=2048900 RepID=UPI000C12AE22|nr:hypothetical protein [Caulobacter sp. BP25]PHY19398.1 hypothetical protein CSW59_13550 [Caulobacter sp. BP25]
MPFSIALRTATAVALLAGGAWAVHAMATDSAPPRKYFVQHGHSYHWSVAHGVTGGLLLVGPARADGSNVDLVLSCSGLKSGGVQARFYAPAANAAQLRVRTTDTVFRVYRGVETQGERSFVGGQGDMPDGYLSSLARTPTLSIEYADRVTTFPGPGEALAGHFGRYCAELAKRAARDE